MSTHLSFSAGLLGFRNSWQVVKAYVLLKSQLFSLVLFGGSTGLELFENVLSPDEQAQMVAVVQDWVVQVRYPFYNQPSALDRTLFTVYRPFDMPCAARLVYFSLHVLLVPHAKQHTCNGGIKLRSAHATLAYSVAWLGEAWLACKAHLLFVVSSCFSGFNSAEASVEIGTCSPMCGFDPASVAVCFTSY